MPFERVKPGDLITANLFNRIVTSLEDLEQKVDALSHSISTSPGPVITEVQPAGPYRLGQEIRVVGKNFAEPSDRNDVSIGGVPVTRFTPDSNSTLLAFTLPTQIPGTPGTARLEVRNGDSSDSVDLAIIDALQIPHGKVVVADKTPALGQINVGATLTFVFLVDSQTNIAETYVFEPKFTGATGVAATEWSSRTTLTVNNGTGASANIKPGSPITVEARVVVPTGATAVTFALRARSLNNDAEVSASSTAIQITVGATQPVNDPRTTIKLRDFGGAAKARKASIDGVDGVEMPYQDQDLVRVDAAFTVEGTYTYSAAIEPDAGSWTLISTAGTVITPASSPETAGSSETLGVTLRLNASDAGVTHPERRTLVIKAQHSTQSFVSFIRIPIQGYVRA